MLLVGQTSCTSFSEPNLLERWEANLFSSQQVLFMSFSRKDSVFTGTGLLAPLRVPGGETRLTLAGVRRADTLDIVFHRSAGGQFRFIGRYLNSGALSGVLSGAEFEQLAVMFKNH